MGNVDILDILLDEDNTDPIVLTNDNGEEFEFEQVAVIPYDDKLYIILRPLDKIEGIKDNEAVVFYVDETDDEHGLKPETDERKGMEVFMEYYNLIEKKFLEDED